MTQEEKIREILINHIKDELYGIDEIGMDDFATNVTKSFYEWHTAELNRRMEEVEKQLKEKWPYNTKIVLPKYIDNFEDAFKFGYRFCLQNFDAFKKGHDLLGNPTETNENI